METGKTHWYSRRRLASVAWLTAILAVGLLSTNARVAIAQPAPLSTVPVRTPIGGDIVDQAAAIRLGKALFWDVQVGGDGQTSCATCHFQGGADNRTFNTLNPGFNKVFNTVTGAGVDFHPANIVTDDVAGSQGLTGLTFVGIDPNPANPADLCGPGGLTTAPFFENRRTTVRNAPTVLNGIIFFREMFWDGRGNEIFNGVNPFGQTGNQTATPGGVIPATNPARTAIGFSALASQAVGPVNRNPEMSCAPTNARAFNGGATNALGLKVSLAAKMLARPVLQHQFVHPGDSVLGPMSASPAKGLKCGADHHPCMYGELITAAFGTKIANPLTQFSRVFGQAVQAYEATLIPDKTPMDKFLAGNATALTARQRTGLGLFGGKGCTRCHAGAELTDASWTIAIQRGPINEDGGDQGFHNLGVRPTAEDLGRGAKGQGGVPFSQSGSAVDMGAFKTVALRNVGLTAPYFHNGGKATLADVVDFYNRGGDFNNVEKARRILPLGMTAAEKAALVDFLQNGLTDCRVASGEAPFDHPSLTVPNGRVVNGISADLEIAATGGAATCQ